MSSRFFGGTREEDLQHWIVLLDSIMDGELAEAMLVAAGERAIPYLKQFLLDGVPRTIALPRCRAARALGELGAYTALIAYFREYTLPPDASVLFAEDAVRSTVARELLRWKTEEVLHVLLNAARQRATGGLVLAIGEFRRAEAVPLLFELLEDDFCREEAKDALRKVPAMAHAYAILMIRGWAEVSFPDSFALRRRRATLQLLEELNVTAEEWNDLREFLDEPDADVVIATARLGFRVGGEDEQRRIVQALFQVSERVHWAQETEIQELLDAHATLAREVAHTVANERRAHGERINWMAPSWRILRHVLGSELDVAGECA